MKWLFLTLFFILPYAQAEYLVAPQFNEGKLKVVNQLEIYETTENFGNSSSDKEALDAGNSFEATIYNLSLQYGGSRDWEFRTGMTFSSATSVTSDVERKNSGVSDLEFGFFYRALDEQLSIYPGFNYSFPVETVDGASDNSIINEGASYLSLPIYFDYKWQFAALYGLFEPQILGDQRGWRYAYVLGLKKRLGSFIFNLELNSFDTFKDDDLTSTPETRTDVVNRVNGGSLRFFSINPGVTRFSAQARFRINKTFIAGLGYSKDLKGSRHSAGSAILGYLEIRLPYDLSINNLNPEDFAHEQDSTDYGSGNVDFHGGFTPEISDEEQQYFREDATSPSFREKKKVKKRKKRRRKKKRKKRRRKSRSSDDEVAEEVEDWELQ